MRGELPKGLHAMIWRDTKRDILTSAIGLVQTLTIAGALHPPAEVHSLPDSELRHMLQFVDKFSVSVRRPSMNGMQKTLAVLSQATDSPHQIG